MFAWQDEIPTFNYLSTEDNAVVALDPDAAFFVARLKMWKWLMRILMMLSSLWHI